MKNKIIISSILTIALCFSLIAGSTFALFTSDSTVNVAVTSGTVSVDATINDNLTLSSLGVAQTSGTFANGGTATISGDTLTLDKLTPGDSASFTIAVVNNSNVAIQYRTIISVVENDLLVDGLEFSFGSVECNVEDGLNVLSVGRVAASAWTPLAPNAGGTAQVIDTVNVTVTLPKDAGNEYQNKSCKLSFTVEAYQGNVTIVEDADSFASALANNAENLTLIKDVVLNDTVTVANNVNINLNGKNLSVLGLNFAGNANVYGGTISSHTNKLTGQPHIIVKSSGTLKLEDVTVNVDDYAAYGESGGLNYAEIMGIAVEGTLILEDSHIIVENNVVRTWNYCYGIAATNGTVIMNGGSIEVRSIGATGINCTTAISSFNSNDTITLNNVTVVADLLGITYGSSHLIINANNSTFTSTEFDVTQGGTYELKVVNN